MRRTHLGSILLAAAGAAGLMALQGNQPAAGQLNGFRQAAKAVTQASARRPALSEPATPPAPMTRPAATAPVMNHRG